MRVNFLAAADGTPLTKTFTAEKNHPYPMVGEFNSYEHDVEGLEAFHEALQLHAEAGHCLLKGALDRPLTGERRAGHTDPLDPTWYVVLDLDFDAGFDDVDAFLADVGLADVSYSLHHSASSGVRARPGLRAHVFILLERPVAPPLLKLWLQHLNLSVPALRELTSLSVNGMSLRWPLDVTVCQNDKLIFIADPNCEGIEDPMRGKRFELRWRGQHAWRFPFKGSEFTGLEERVQLRINELRQAAGMSRRTGTFKRATYNGATFEYLKNPNRARVTESRQARGFTYLNLNGGDSWAYYYPDGRPEFVYNFKGEPIVRLKDIDSEYYDRIKPPTTEPEEVGDAFVFRVKENDVCYSAELKGDDVEVYRLSRQSIEDFYLTRGLGVPESIPEWRLEFDPTRLEKIDRTERWLNTFRPTPYLIQHYAPGAAIPPTVGRILRSICVDEPTLEHFLNWLAYIFQTRQRSNVAWIFRGTTGTGKGIFVNRILKPIFGADVVREITMEVFREKFNDYMDGSMFVVINEGEVSDREATEIIAKTKHIIDAPSVELRRLHQGVRPIKNFVNLILNTNNRAPIKIDREDRRWNVAPAQEAQLKEHPNDSMPWLEDLEAELEDFCAYLAHYKVDARRAQTPLYGDSREELFLATETSIERLFRAFKEGDLDWFVEMAQGDSSALLDPTYTRFSMAVQRWCREYELGPVRVASEEARDAYCYLTGNRTTPVKFGRITANHWERAGLMRDGTAVFRGWEVPFKTTEPELAARFGALKQKLAVVK